MQDDLKVYLKAMDWCTDEETRESYIDILPLEKLLNLMEDTLLLKKIPFGK